MLAKKNTFFKYKSLLSFSSFNNNSINSYVWNIRRTVAFLFFFLYKKSYFLKIYFKYNFLIYCIILKSKFAGHYCNNISVIKDLYINKYCFFINKLYFDTIFNLKRTSTIFFLMSSRVSLFLSNVTYLRKYNYFYNLFNYYNNNIFLTMVWLYNLKLSTFFNINISSLPHKLKKFIVLKSPHTDKKSREKFNIKRIKKTLFYPSIFNTTSNFLFVNFINENLLIKNLNNNKVF